MPSRSVETRRPGCGAEKPKTANEGRRCGRVRSKPPAARPRPARRSRAPTRWHPRRSASTGCCAQQQVAHAVTWYWRDIRLRAADAHSSSRTDCEVFAAAVVGGGRQSAGMNSPRPSLQRHGMDVGKRQPCPGEDSAGKEQEKSFKFFPSQVQLVDEFSQIGDHFPAAELHCRRHFSALDGEIPVEDAEPPDLLERGQLAG